MPYTNDSRDFNSLVEETKKPIKILAEGDSWFAYPRKWIVFGAASNIVQVLGKKNRNIIYTTASNSDEAVTMMSGEQKISFTKRIMHNEFDIILFSGGGNDIVGKYDFDFFIKYKDSSTALSDYINFERLNNKLNQIKSVYIELIERTIEFSKNKNVKIITHTYDFINPMKEGFKLFDLIPIGESWVYPFFFRKGFKDIEEQKEITKIILKEFKKILLEVQASYPDRLVVVDTQGLLEEKHWRNEIHPKPSGFKIISKAIQNQINQIIS